MVEKEDEDKDKDKKDGKIELDPPVNIDPDYAERNILVWSDDGLSQSPLQWTGRQT